MNNSFTQSGKLTGEVTALKSLKATVTSQKTLTAEMVSGKALNGAISKATRFGTMPLVDETLKYSDTGVLGVNTTNEVEQDNTLPITASAVFTTVGNIEILLGTI